MKKTEFISFEKYLKNKGIELYSFEHVDIRGSEAYSLDNIKIYITFLKEFHEKASGYNVFFISKLENNLGKNFEYYKINLKRLKTQINKIILNEPKDIFEEHLINIGYKYIEKAEKSIKEITDNNYLDLIRRSMDKTEICIGNNGIHKVFKKDNLIVTDISACNYDIIEMDCINLINKLKRSNIRIDYNSIIEYFCETEELNEDSINVIKAAVSYPNEIMKCCSKYRKHKHNLDPIIYKKRLEKAVLKDNIIAM